MGQCFGKKSAKVSAIESQNHKQIELNLRADRDQKRVFFTGNHAAIANIFCTIDDSQSLHRIQNCSTLLVSGYIRKSTSHAQVPNAIQLLLTEFYGKINFPNHYEFQPKLTLTSSNNNNNSKSQNTTKGKVRKPTPYPHVPKTPKWSPSTFASSTITTIDGDISYPNHLQFPNIPVPSDTEEEKDACDSQLEYQLNFPNYATQKQAQLMITYHNLQCFKKKDYYLKWIHLLDNSLSIIFVADLSQIVTDIVAGVENEDKLLLKDMERFRRLMFYSNGKYDSRMPILVLSGIDRFNCALSKQEYRYKFEAQFPSFRFIENDEQDTTISFLSYYEQALQHIKNQYVMIFDHNLRNGSKHWTKKKRLQPQKLFIRTINDINDINEVQRVWIKLNKALIHGNIMHELRNGGIAI
mmetsp:Transcript_70532/g.63337  ORF Transcript_70532/g.63337 Transcript_70532/m.63337 type:complete len:410 (-) Transcript_70532:485-1714(-)